MKSKGRNPKKRRTDGPNYDLRTLGTGSPEGISSVGDVRRRLRGVVMNLNDLNKTYLRTK